MNGIYGPVSQPQKLRALSRFPVIDQAHISHN